jgi:hypothetical protein
LYEVKRHEYGSASQSTAPLPFVAHVETVCEDRAMGTVERMSDDNTPENTGAVDQSAEKDPSDWVTGDEPPTGPQLSYLETLAREAKEDVPSDLNKAQASEMIDRLQSETGRGTS